MAVWTQAPQHAPIVTGAARLGVEAILCEKPVAPTRVETDRMLEVCSRAGPRPAVNHQPRMIPNTFLVERPLRDGAIGDRRAARMPDKGGRPAGSPAWSSWAPKATCAGAGAPRAARAGLGGR